MENYERSFAAMDATDPFGFFFNCDLKGVRPPRIGLAEEPPQEFPLGPFALNDLQPADQIGRLNRYVESFNATHLKNIKLSGPVGYAGDHAVAAQVEPCQRTIVKIWNVQDRRAHGLL